MENIPRECFYQCGISMENVFHGNSTWAKHEALWRLVVFHGNRNSVEFPRGIPCMTSSSMKIPRSIKLGPLKCRITGKLSIFI